METQYQKIELHSKWSKARGRNIWNDSLNLNNLYNELVVMKFKDLVKLNNFLFVFDHRNENLPDAFQSYFHTSNEHQNHTTTRAQKMLIVVPMRKTLIYGWNFVISQSIFAWNKIVEKINYNLDIGRTQFITTVKKYFLPGNDNNSESVISLSYLYSY